MTAAAPAADPYFATGVALLRDKTDDGDAAWLEDARDRLMASLETISRGGGGADMMMMKKKSSRNNEVSSRNICPVARYELFDAGASSPGWGGPARPPEYRALACRVVTHISRPPSLSSI